MHVVFGFIIGAGMVVAANAISTKTQEARTLVSQAVPLGEITVEDMCMEVWLPDDWLAIAAKAKDQGILDSYEAFRTYLERTGRQELWYVIVFEQHQANFETRTRVYLRQPYAQPEQFDEVREVLSTASGQSESKSQLDLSADLILAIPDEFRGLGPAEVYARLVSGWKRNGPGRLLLTADD
jgi:hypothetical protein